MDACTEELVAAVDKKQRPRIEIKADLSSVSSFREIGQGIVDAQDRGAREMQVVLEKLAQIEMDLEILKTAELMPYVIVAGGEKVMLRDMPRESIVAAKAHEAEECDRELEGIVRREQEMLDKLGASLEKRRRALTARSVNPPVLKVLPFVDSVTAELVETAKIVATEVQQKRRLFNR